MASNVSIPKMYSLLVDKVGKEQAESIATYIEEKVNAEVETTARHLATKEDLANTKNDIIKWMFGFWVGSIGLAILFYFIKG